MENELVDDRIKVFQRPKMKEQVISGKDLIVVGKLEELLPKLENRKRNEAFLIMPQVELIPGQSSGKLKYQDTVNFSKRGPLVEIRTYKTEEEAIENKWGDLKARIDAWERYKERRDEPFVGWVWNDPEGYAHIVHPSTILEGYRLSNYGFKSRNIKDKTAAFPSIKKEYQARDSPFKTVRVLVPSRSESMKREILVEHIANPNDPKRFLEWTRLTTRHECPLKREDFSFKFKKYVTYCPHDVSAFATISRNYAEEHRRIINQPFPLFSEPLLRFYMTLAYHSLKADVLINNDETKQRIRPLTFPEIDRTLMHAWLKYGNKATFFAHAPTPTKSYKLMRNFDWSIDGPGIPFVDKV